MSNMRNGWLVLTLLCLSGPAHANWAEYQRALAMLKDATTANDAQGAAAMLRLAEGGDMDAQAYMAYLHNQGIGVARDPAASARWEARALAHPQVTDTMKTSFKSLRGADAKPWLAELFLTSDAGSRENKRMIEEAEKSLDESAAVLEEATATLTVVNAEIEQALKEREQLQAQLRLESQKLSQLQSVQTLIDSGGLARLSAPAPAAAPAPAPASGAANPQQTALKAIYANAIAGDAQAKVDLATLYFLGETKGIVAARHDLHCYLWSLQIDPQQDPTAAVMADDCGEGLPPEVRENVVTIVDSLKERPRPAPLPTTRDQAVADFIAGLEFDDKQQLRGIKREDLSLLGDSWGLFVGHRYGLWFANDALLLSVCGKPCAPETAATGILEAAWDTLWQRFGLEPAYQPAKPIAPGTALQRAVVNGAVAAFLERLDRGAPETTWAEASPLLRDKHRNVDAWAVRLRAHRGIVGAVRNRSPAEYAFSARVDDLPAGEYVVVGIATTFANRNARERIVLQKEAGRWRVLDYALTWP